MTKKRKSEMRALKTSFSKFTNERPDPIELDIEGDDFEEQHSKKLDVRQKSKRKSSVEHKKNPSVLKKARNTEGSSSAKRDLKEDDVNENTQIVIYSAPFIKGSIPFMPPADDSDFVKEPLKSVFEESSEAATSGSKAKGKEKVVEVDVTEAGKSVLSKASVAATSRSKAKGKKKVAEVEVKSLRTRTSPRSLSTAIKQLSEKQISCVNEMGLGALLDLDIDQIPGALGYYVADNLDTTTLSITMKHGVLQFNKEGIHRVTNLPKTGVVLEKCHDQSRIISESRWWTDQHVNMNVCPTDIVTRLKSNKFADYLFKVDFSMLFITTMIDSGSNGRCIKAYIPFFKEDMDFSSIDWCATIMKYIKDCTEQWRRKDRKKPFLGPLPFMVLYYVSSVRNESFPLHMTNIGFKRWNTKNLQDRQTMELKAGGFGLCERIEGGSSSSNGDDIDGDNHNTEPNEQLETNEQEATGIDADVQENVQDTVSKLKHLLNVVKSASEEFEVVFRDAVEKHNFQVDLMHVFNKFKKTIRNHCECALGVGTDDDTPDTDDPDTGSGSDDDAPTDGANNDKTDTEPLVCGNRDEAPTDGGKNGKFVTASTTGGADIDYTQVWKNPDFIKEVCETMDKASSSKTVRVDVIVNEGIKSDLDGPSFSLGITQDLDDQMLKTHVVNDVDTDKFFDSQEHIPLSEVAKKLLVKQKGKERAVRVKRPGVLFKSPYVERPIDIKGKRSKIEKDVWKYIHQNYGPTDEVLFHGRNGTTGKKFVLESLAPNTLIEPAVVSCFAVVMNVGEVNICASSPYRAYLEPLVMNGSSSVHNETSVAEGINLLRKNVISILGIDPAIQSLKPYDMLFLPILFIDQYVLLCFDFKNQPINVIDGLDRSGGKNRRKKVENQIDDYVEIFRTIIAREKDVMVGYLRTYGSTKANSIDAVVPVWLNMTCSTKIVEESGLMLMRHMETYKGGLCCGCGIVTDPSRKRKNFESMRVKYLSKILVGEANQLKKNITDAIEMGV